MDRRLRIAFAFGLSLGSACYGEAPPDGIAAVAPVPEPEADLLEWDPAVGDVAPALADAAAGPTPVFLVGTNPVLRDDGISDFVPVPDGGDVPVVVGSNGLFMVIFAIRTTGLLVSPVDVDAELRYNGKHVSDSQFVDIDLEPLEDGLDYLWDVFLPFEGTPFTGLSLELDLDIVGADGKGVSIEQTVVPSW